MANYTDADVTRLLEQGVTLPPPSPDPAVVVARVLAGAATPGLGWGPVDLYPVHADLLVAVRGLFSPEALSAAAAKVQEADRD